MNQDIKSESGEAVRWSAVLGGTIEQIRKDAAEMDRLVWEQHERVETGLLQKVMDLQEAINDIADIMDMPQDFSPQDCVDAVRGMRNSMNAKPPND